MSAIEFVDRLRKALKASPLAYRVLRPIMRSMRNIREAYASRGINRFRKHCLILSRHVERPYFVKVGANDGLSGDPCSDILIEHGWRGLLIEPVPHLVARLQANFPDRTRFKVECVAVGVLEGHAPFYYLDPVAARTLPGLPSYFDQLGSFDRDHIGRHLGAAAEPCIRTRDVPVQRLSSVLRRHGIDRLDLLHVDTEGHDLEVMRSLDLESFTPTLILVEHKHLSPGDRRELDALLIAGGYVLNDCGADLFALHRDAFRSTTAARSLHPPSHRKAA